MLLLSGRILPCVSGKPCVSGNVVKWTTHWDIRILVPMSYLKFGKISSVRPVVSSRRRPLSVRPSCRLSCRPFCRPSYRRRPSSVRRGPSYPVVSRRRPLFVRPSRRRPSSVRRAYQLTESNECILFKSVIRVQQTAAITLF